MVSQDFGSKLVEWLDIIHGEVWFGSRIKRDAPHYFHDTNAKNDDLEILCKTGHACTYADTQVSNLYGHVMLGLRIHFLYFKSTQCFQNMFFCQFVHSSESILGVWENLHSIHPSGVYTFFQKLVMISEFFQRKVGSHLFSKACWFFCYTTYFFFFSLFFLLFFFIFYFFFLFVFFFFFS